VSLTTTSRVAVSLSAEKRSRASDENENENADPEFRVTRAQKRAKQRQRLELQRLELENTRLQLEHQHLQQTHAAALTARDNKIEALVTEQKHRSDWDNGFADAWRCYVCNTPRLQSVYFTPSCQNHQVLCLDCLLFMADGLLEPRYAKSSAELGGLHLKLKWETGGEYPVFDDSGRPRRDRDGRELREDWARRCPYCKTGCMTFMCQCMAPACNLSYLSAKFHLDNVRAREARESSSYVGVPPPATVNDSKIPTDEELAHILALPDGISAIRSLATWGFTATHSQISELLKFRGSFKEAKETAIQEAFTSVGLSVSMEQIRKLAESAIRQNLTEASLRALGITATAVQISALNEKMASVPSYELLKANRLAQWSHAFSAARLPPTKFDLSETDVSVHCRFCGFKDPDNDVRPVITHTSRCPKRTFKCPFGGCGMRFTWEKHYAKFTADNGIRADDRKFTEGEEGLWMELINLAWKDHIRSDCRQEVHCMRTGTHDKFTCERRAR
jgi:hypothetical protein